MVELRLRHRRGVHRAGVRAGRRQVGALPLRDDRGELTAGAGLIAHRRLLGHARAAEADRASRAGRRASATREKPSVLIAHTIKGKGVPYMENIPTWHGSVKLTPAQTEEALTALGASPDEIRGFMNV